MVGVKFNLYEINFDKNAPLKRVQHRPTALLTKCLSMLDSVLKLCHAGILNAIIKLNSHNFLKYFLFKEN